MKPTKTTPPKQMAEPSDVEAEAMAWVVRLTSGETDAAERGAFEAWRARSPAHEAAIAEARKLWLGLGDVLPAPAIGVPDKSARIVPSPKLLPRWRMDTGVAIAASIAVLVVCGLQYVTNWRHDYVTASGQRQVVMLADGTRVQLGSGSAIDVEDSANARRIRLVRGEAYFDVVHDAQRPFVVDAGDDAVHDVGTAFSVRMDGEGVLVVVERGEVEVTGGVNPVSVKPDQRVRYSGKARNVRVEAANVAEDLAWTNGRLILEDRSLREVVDELNRYYGKNIIVFGDDIEGRRINAVVDLDHIDDWLEALRDSQNLNVRRVPGFVFLF